MTFAVAARGSKASPVSDSEVSMSFHTPSRWQLRLNRAPRSVPVGLGLPSAQSWTMPVRVQFDQFGGQEEL
ncbi:hypothetical protein ACIQFZ_41890 [Streptomyces sp. NPDC093064]|uniref:hypothetical protein n=1 Tax=Streptomyces sp. NPDC093064 TaxID=3366020 RepID=UPI003804D753